MRTALVLPGGGSRSVFVSGVVIGSGLRPEQVSSVYALSSSGAIAAYFVIGQIQETGPAWIDQLKASRFLAWSRLLRLRHPGEVHRLIGYGCRTLKVEAIPPEKLYVSTMRLYDGRTMYHKVTPQNAHEVLEATCSYPILTTPRVIDGQRHVDGGVEDTFPVLKAYVEGSSKILAIGNRPKAYQMEPYGRLACWLTFPLSPLARRALGRRASLLEETQKFIDNPPSDARVLHLSPDKELPATRFTTDETLIRKTFDLGLEMGKKNMRRIQDFVAS